MAALGGAMASAGAQTAATPLPQSAPATGVLKAASPGLPTGKLGNLTVPRIILGCNQVSGYAHCRNLSYVSRLMQEYQTEGGYSIPGNCVRTTASTRYFPIPSKNLCA